MQTLFVFFYRPHSEGMGKVLFSQVSVHISGGGYPLPTNGVYPIWLIGGVPHLANGGGGTPSGWWGVPHEDWMGIPHIRRQSSRAITCYAMGGMPLAFTQEDFLVYLWIYITIKISSYFDAISFLDNA